MLTKVEGAGSPEPTNTPIPTDETDKKAYHKISAWHRPDRGVSGFGVGVPRDDRHRDSLCDVLVL